jgi:hypothetical protein
VANGTVLQELSGAKVVHPEEQVVLENLLVSLAVYSGILRQEVNVTSSLSRKANPTITGSGCFTFLDVQWGSQQLDPLGLLTLRLVAPECRLVPKHDVRPALFSQVFLIPTEKKPLLLYLQGEQWLLGSGPARQAQHHLQVALDRTLTDHREPYNRVFKSAPSLPGIS